VRSSPAKNDGSDLSISEDSSSSKSSKSSYVGGPLAEFDRRLAQAKKESAEKRLQANCDAYLEREERKVREARLAGMTVE